MAATACVTEAPRRRTALGAYVVGVVWLGGLGAGLASGVSGGGDHHHGAAAPVARTAYAAGQALPLSFGSLVAHRVEDVQRHAPPGVPKHHFAPRGRTLVSATVTVTNTRSEPVRFPLHRVGLVATRRGRRALVPAAGSTDRGELIPAGGSVTGRVEFLAPPRSRLALRVHERGRPPLTLATTVHTRAGVPAARVVRRDRAHGSGH